MKWHHQAGRAVGCCDTNTGTAGRRAGGWVEAPALGLQGRGQGLTVGGKGAPQETQPGADGQRKG